MQIKKPKQLFVVALKFNGGITRIVKVRAVTRDVAERQALKRNKSAIGVDHGS